MCKKEIILKIIISCILISHKMRHKMSLNGQEHSIVEMKISFSNIDFNYNYIWPRV